MDQGTKEESCLPVHWLLGIQTSVLAIDAEEAHKAAVASLWCGPGAPGDKPSKLRQTLDFRRAL